MRDLVQREILSKNKSNKLPAGAPVMEKLLPYSRARFTVLKADSMNGLSLGVRGRANNWGIPLP